MRVIPYYIKLYAGDKHADVFWIGSLDPKWWRKQINK